MRQAFLNNIYPGQPATRILSTLVFALLFSHHAAAGISSDVPTAPPASFTYELVGVARYEGISYASLIDPQTGYHFLLSTIARSGLGLVLASVATDDDPSGASVTLEKDGVSVTLGLWESASLDPAAAPLSTPPAPSVVSSTIAPTAPAHNNYPKPPPGANLPLVFQEVDPARMTLTADQKATLDQLRQDFINDVSGASSANTSTASSTVATSSAAASPAGVNQNSTSDAQSQNWLTAQEKSDQTFRMLFGTQAFVAYTESSSYPTPP